MLNSINLNDKIYEDLFAEALAQISIYSKEWTNFNPSDPGITLLENLTAFNLLQQSRINHVTDDIRRSMLKLLGCQPRTNQAATAFVKLPEGEEVSKLPAQYQFYSGSLCFETDDVTPIFNWSIRGAYTKISEEFRDITYLIKHQHGAIAVFGTEPREGAALYLILDGDVPTGEWICFRVECGDGQLRNLLSENDASIDQVQWQAYTEQGWIDIDAKDESRGFFSSGILSVRIPEGGLAHYTEAPESGAALRCVLKSGCSEHPAKLQRITENLFPLVQKQTHSRSILFAGNDEIEVISQLAADGFIFVYCKEAEGKDYRLYKPYSGTEEQGRFYQLEPVQNGAVIRFDKDKFGFGPVKGEDTVCVVCCDEMMIHHRDLGVVYGYDDQIISMDFIEDVLPESFSVMAEIPDSNGDYFYRVMKAGQTDPHELCFELYSHEGELRIIHPGVGTTYHLYACDCAVTRGGNGNIRDGSTLIHREGLPGMENERHVKCIGQAEGGQSWESPEDMRLRFVDDLRQVHTAVLPSDYEALALATPGLAIHKANAWADPEKNIVWVAVKPMGNGKSYPQLSPNYINEISGYLNRFRMITTRVELVQPRYVPIHVSARFRVKKHYQSVEQEVRDLLVKILDHVEGEDDFGGWIRFDELHRRISRLSGIVGVDSLHLTAGDTLGAKQVGTDIRLAEDSLACPGNMHLDFTYEIIRGR